MCSARLKMQRVRALLMMIHRTFPKIAAGEATRLKKGTKVGEATRFTEGPGGRCEALQFGSGGDNPRSLGGVLGHDGSPTRFEFLGGVSKRDQKYLRTSQGLCPNPRPCDVVIRVLEASYVGHVGRLSGLRACGRSDYRKGMR